MAVANLSLPGWYAAWIPHGIGPRARSVVFGFRDQEGHFLIEVGHRYVPLTDPALSDARLVGPFRSPEAAQAALYVTQARRRDVAGA